MAEQKRVRIMRHGREVFAEEQAADNVMTVTVDGGKPMKLDGTDVVIELRGKWEAQPEDTVPAPPPHAATEPEEPKPTRKRASRKGTSRKTAAKKSTARSSKLATS